MRWVWNPTKVSNILLLPLWSLSLLTYSYTDSVFPEQNNCIFIQSYLQAKEREYLVYMLTSILIFV